MTISTHITRLAKIFALALAAAAFAVPAAIANDGLVDDWFRDPVMVVRDATPAAGVDPATGRPLRESGEAPVAYRSTAGGFQTPAAGVDPATGRPLRESGGAPVAYRSTAGGFQTPAAGVDPASGRPTRESGGAAPVASQQTADGFHWSDFGIGAGAMLGLVLLLAGLSLGALAARHRGGTLRTS